MKRSYARILSAVDVPPSAYAGMTGGFGAFPIFDDDHDVLAGFG
jgi:hypothetical protein